VRERKERKRETDREEECLRGEREMEKEI